MFKVNALRGLKSIFPSDVNPLYASFGSSPSDMEAYRQASIYTTSILVYIFTFYEWSVSVLYGHVASHVEG